MFTLIDSKAAFIQNPPSTLVSNVVWFDVVAIFLNETKPRVIDYTNRNIV